MSTDRVIAAVAVPLAAQDRIRASIEQRRRHASPVKTALSAISVFLAAVYGGYFGAELGIILLAVLGVVIDDSLTYRTR